MKIVILGLSITSSWGNGHATTYRALVRALAARGHDILFLERDAPWYAGNRDLPEPPYCRTALYDELTTVEVRHGDEICGGGPGDRRILCPGRYCCRPHGPPAGSRSDCLLRHRHAGDARTTGDAAARITSSRRRSPAVRSVSVVHRRPDAGAAPGDLRGTDGAAAVLLCRSRSVLPRGHTRRPSLRHGLPRHLQR